MILHVHYGVLRNAHLHQMQACTGYVLYGALVDELQKVLLHWHNNWGAWGGGSAPWFSDCHMSQGVGLILWLVLALHGCLMFALLIFICSHSG